MWLMGNILDTLLTSSVTAIPVTNAAATSVQAEEGQLNISTEMGLI